jgi:hypothetical protein
VLESGAELPQPKAKLPGDERALRGIPVAGVGGGAIAGTRPLQHVLWQEARDARFDVS